MHVDDVADLLLIVLRHALSPSALSSTERFNPYQHYYIAKGSSLEWRDINGKLAKILHERMKLKENVPRDVTYDEAGVTAL